MKKTTLHIEKVRISLLTCLLAVGLILPGSPCQAQSTGQWVWANTGWGRNPAADSDNTTYTTGPTPVPIFTVTEQIYPASTSCRGHVKAYVAGTRSASASVSFATSRTFYWKTNCGTPCPTAPTFKTGTISASYSGSTSVTQNGSLNTGDAGITFYRQFYSSDDYTAGGDPSENLGTYSSTPSAYGTAVGIGSSGSPFPASGSGSFSGSASGNMNCKTTFFAQYSVTASVTGLRGVFITQDPIVSATGDIEGSVPQ